jgi:hypothetical protein
MASQNNERLMMKTNLSILCFLTLLSSQISSQSDSSSVYSNLKKIKIYAVSLSYTCEDGKATYQVNDKIVSKRTFNKYDKTWEELEGCCPCIIESYDENDILLYEGVACGDCYVGYYKEFYPNGQIKSAGSFKENTSGNWANIYDRGYCAVYNGQWTFYDENGNILYSEYWLDGDFLRQVPEQNKTEIWRVDLLLNDEPVGDKWLLPTQLKDLIITPRFKNAARDSVNLTLEFTATAISRKSVRQNFTFETFKSFDLNQALLENGFKSDDQIRYSLMVMNNESYIASFNLNIKPDLPKSTETVLQKVDSTFVVDNNTEIFLLNSIDSTKSVKLVPRITYSLNYSEATDDTLILEKTIVLHGFIRKENQSSVIFDMWRENIYLEHENGIESEIHNNYPYSQDENLRKINIENINYIDYKSPSLDALQTIGSAATFLSIVSTVIVAPLLSINYKNGDFNQDRYYTIAGAGLIGLSVGIPLQLFSNSRSYKITSPGSTKAKDLWYIKSQIKSR